MNAPAGLRPSSSPSSRNVPLNTAEHAKALYEISRLPEALSKRDIPAVLAGLGALVSLIPDKVNPLASGASLVNLNTTLMAIGQDYQATGTLQSRHYLALTSAVLDVVGYFSAMLGAPQISAIARGLSIATDLAARSETLNQILTDPYNPDNPGYKALGKQLGALADGQFIDEAFDTVGQWILPAPSTSPHAPALPAKTTPPLPRPAPSRPAASRTATRPARRRATAPSGTSGNAGRTNKAAVIAAMHAAGITDPDEQAMFLAQVDHESGGFKRLNESFKYRNAGQLMAVSKTARKHGTAAVEAALASGPEAVAALMYGGRMGNRTAEDAYRYRGRGFIQLTGRDNYARAGKALGLDLPNQPDLAADPAIAARIATWYWQSRPGLAEAGRAGDVKAATRRINGGDNGLSDRKEKFARYLREVQAGLPQPAGTPVARAQPGQPPAAAGPAGSLSAITTRPAPGAPEAATLGQLQSMLSQLDDMVCRLSAVQPATREAEAGQLAAAVNHANQLTARRS